MKKNFDFFGIMAKFQAVAAKVKFFFAVLAKVEVFYMAFALLNSVLRRFKEFILSGIFRIWYIFFIFYSLLRSGCL